MTAEEETSTELASPERPKRRRLKHPRISNACAFCRRRKSRCSETRPCELCIREGVDCEYITEGSLPRPLPFDVALPTTGISTQRARSRSEDQAVGHRKNRDVPNTPVSEDHTVYHQDTAEILPANFAQDHHVGPTSGVSFLYHYWNQGNDSNSQNDLSASDQEENGPALHAYLTTYGDIPSLSEQTMAVLPPPVITAGHMVELLDRYFEYVSPTQRYLHKPTTVLWGLAYTRQDSNLSVGQAAVILLVCAQTLLQPFKFLDEAVASDAACLRLSTACSLRAKALLEHERGPASLLSVQARMAMCLYLLSTFRLNECRYCFSFTVTVATAMGLHRRHSSMKVDSLEAECRKRTFWSLYILDGYLSVMLGRPRLLRLDDIDQFFPANVDDHDLVSCGKLEHLPEHGNLEALVAQAKLAKLTALNDDQLYPLQPLSHHELLRRSGNMLDRLQQWQDELPSFLQPRATTSTGQKTFERQNTILKLAAAHTRILMTRRCLLLGFGPRSGRTNSGEMEIVFARRCVRECVAGITATLDTVEALISDGRCHSSLWSTQYIALVALSTLYVLVLQGGHDALPDVIDSFLDVDTTLATSQRCQNFLAALAPSGSQARRHHLLLARLRSRVDKSVIRREQSQTNLVQGRLEDSTGPSSTQTDETQQDLNVDEVSRDRNAHSLSTWTDFSVSAYPLANQTLSNDLLTFSTILTPDSSSDAGFNYMLEFGWEGLDTVGMSTVSGTFQGLH